MNKFLVFPYENHIENILKSLEDKMYGRVEDILTLNGWWVKTKPEIHVGNKEIKIKKNIDEISKECNSLWVVESYFSLDFISEIVPILIYAKEKRWTVYYGRRTSDSEEKIIREIEIVLQYKNNYYGIQFSRGNLDKIKEGGAVMETPPFLYINLTV